MNNEISEIAKNEIKKEEKIENEFQTELNRKYDNYANRKYSLEDIQRDKEKLLKLREELIRYKESKETDSTEDEEPQKVLKFTRYR